MLPYEITLIVAGSILFLMIGREGLSRYNTKNNTTNKPKWRVSGATQRRKRSQSQSQSRKRSQSQSRKRMPTITEENEDSDGKNESSNKGGATHRRKRRI